ncbi:hypothetical protein PBI_MALAGASYROSE_81 [Mycobacterium phage MalagasyRose]|uniref:Uncharacterized protein n=1 Tax=Mycobacterium phage MalagasyRose TaxID=2599870 RepID=A0A5J6TGP4_9CAUD|nr:hypothetical protein QEH39_gp07 [Mycobacterium phage MalagasyRose]QFG08929.1 hypothetical protein PBI_MALAGASYROSE_81 [Mycobacterium phage MalagasyRose]
MELLDWIYDHVPIWAVFAFMVTMFTVSAACFLWLILHG